MIGLAVSGAGGRMGCAIIRTIVESNGVTVRAALENKASPVLGQDAGSVAGGDIIDIPVKSELDHYNFDVLIEFTTPAATLVHLESCRQRRKGIVIGTTGIDADGKKLIEKAASEIPVVYAANTSVGVNLCTALVETASRVLGETTDIEIIEAHHRDKVDAPSGTALLLGEAAARPLGRDLSRDGVYSRHGHTGARPAGAIGFSTIRGGDIAGEHTVMFIGDCERIEITHRATDRKIFARGAVQAARWLANRPAGLFDMCDVLQLR